MNDADTAPKVVHRGGCHCGDVRFSVRAPENFNVIECNCSICTKSGFLHLIVTADDFELETDESKLALYTFNTGKARHLFCARCGIKSFYVPRSHPDGFSVNVRCLDPGTCGSIDVTPFDGARWESAIGAIR